MPKASCSGTAGTNRGIGVAFPFGHGLSYTTFAMGEPELSSTTIEPGGGISVRIPVTNIGDRSGTEVVQLYVAPKNALAFRPPKELKGFAKATLGPGQTSVVEILLDDRAFARWADPDPAFAGLAQQLARDAFWTRAAGSDRRARLGDGPRSLRAPRRAIVHRHRAGRVGAGS